MSAIKVKLIRDTPGDCPKCKTKKSVPEVYANWCRACRAVAYLEFRHAMNWPMSEVDMRNYGLMP